MTDLATTHNHAKGAEAGSQHKRKAAERYVRVLRLSSSGALAAVAFTGVVVGIATKFVDGALSVPSWLEWTAGGIGFLAVITAAYVLNFKDR